MHKALRASILPLLSCTITIAQTVSVPPDATECLVNGVCCYEETTYDMWNLRLSSDPDHPASQTIQPIKHPQSVSCHLFDENGHETVVTRYVQRDANVGSIGMDENGNVDFVANDIKRDIPDTRTFYTYDDKGRNVTRKTWSFNLGDSTLILSDSCIYDSDGQLCGILIQRDSINMYGICRTDDRNGSYTVSFSDGTSEKYRYDSEKFLVRYTDRDLKTVRYSYNERGDIIRQLTEWEDGATLNVVFEEYQFDENGNWTSRKRIVKDPGQQPRSTKITERIYRYR